MSQSGSLRNSGGSGGSGIVTIDGDTGFITGSTVTIYAHQSVNNSGQTVLLTGNDTTTMTFNVTDAAGNTTIGRLAGNSALVSDGGTNNTSLGLSAGASLGEGATNTLIGANTGAVMTADTNQTALGANALTLANNGQGNTAIGEDSLNAITSGSYNTAIGSASGVLYTSTESSNILLANSGVLGESNVMRLGTQGSGAGEVDECFIAGITGNTITSTPMMVTIDNSGGGTNGQMGIAAIPGGFGSPTYFSAFLSAPLNNVTGDGTLYGPIVFDSTLTNVGTAYNPATGIFTAPVSGVYSFQSTIQFLGGDVLTLSYLTVWNGSVFNVRSFSINPIAPASDYVALSFSTIIPMLAGATMSIQAAVVGTNKNMSIYGQAIGGASITSLFSGSRIA